jgi:hypothetical protein
MHQTRVHSSSMGTTAAIQRGLFGEDFEVVLDSNSQGWRERAEELIRISEAHGGLVPQSALPEVLGISRQRVHQLIQSGQFEQRKVFGVGFVTGRSIDAWEKDEEKSKGGWRARRGSVWDRMSASVKLGNAIGDAIA